MKPSAIALISELGHSPARAAAVILAFASLHSFGQQPSAPTKSFVEGVIAGCIDGQKRVLEKQGKPYAGAEELIRQFCWCQASTVIDINSTPEGKRKLSAGDPSIRKRLQAANDACTDGVARGRQFAPQEKEETRSRGWGICFDSNGSPECDHQLSIDRAAWRSLKRGMDEAAVRRLLGEPNHVKSAEIITTWRYSNGYSTGEVRFDKASRLIYWSEP